MTLTTPYQASFYVGDGETKAFPFVFEELSDTFVKVIVSHIDGTTSIPTYIVDLDLKQVVFGDETPAPTADDVVCIYRETPTIQDTPFKTLEGYNAKALENILSKIVAMIQEIKSNYFSTQVLQGDPWQLDLLKSADDGATVNIDYTAKKLVKGLYFQITDGNLQVSADGSNYITMPKSTDVAEFRQNQIELPDHTYQYKLQYRVGSTWYDADVTAQNTADAAYSLASTVQADLSSHTNNQNNPHQTSVAKLTDTDINNPTLGHFLRFDGTKWVNSSSDVTSVDWGEIEGKIADQTDLMNTFVKKSGDTMTGALNLEVIASSNTPLLTLTHSNNATYKWNIATRYNSTTLSVYPGSTETNGFRFATTGFVPASNDARYLGSASLKWKGVYTGVINNGYDIAVPAKSGTLATKEEVDLAANSGSQLYATGVWYAKMYAATVVPTGAEYNDRNYADFSQVDRRSGKHIIVIYSCRNGVWAEVETITPPDSYNGYITITSKIWDITEQAGQQGGEILWSFERQRFTPYPKIISFESINVTGDSTVTMPLNPTGSSIVNKDYVDTAISNIDALPTQTGHAGEYLTTDGSSASWAAINAGSGYHPDLFDWKWADHQVNDVQWLRADTFSWQQGSVYKAAYKHLRNDTYNWYSWENNGTTIYTKKAYPEVGEKVYSNSALTTEVGEITDVTDTLDITVEKITVNDVVYDSVTGSNIAPTTETIAGVTVQYIPAEDGHKIVTDFHISEVEAVYAATGVAWYYILDYGFKRFKLPRTKFGVTGLRDTVGKYVEAGLPNITAKVQFTGDTNAVAGGGAAYATADSRSHDLGGGTGVYSASSVLIDASKQNSIYGNSDTVQPPATQMYLYFYVGEFTQEAIENTAGITTETINDLGAHIVTEVQLPTAGNNYTWYRKYADGWVEQGGIYDNGSSVQTRSANITLPITMADSNYTVIETPSRGTVVNTATSMMTGTHSKTTTGFSITWLGINTSDTVQFVNWQVSGMAA